MTPRQRYQVIGELATGRTATPHGLMIITFNRGAILPDDIPQDTIDHLLSVKLIAPIGEPAPATVSTSTPGPDADLEEAAAAALNAAIDEVPAGEAQPAPETDADIRERRIAARAKLPLDGTPPKKTHGHQVWAEYAVRRGVDRTQAESATKDELIELVDQWASA
jgi:hypothetical protein